MKLGVYSLVTPDYQIDEAADLVASSGLWTTPAPCGTARASGTS